MEESIREQVERRAYELFVERGGQEGYHIQDWLQAEADIVGKGTERPKKKAGPRKKKS